MTGEGPVILNVDDREVSRYTRTRSLKQAGFAVVEAATGAEALRLAEEMLNELGYEVDAVDHGAAGIELLDRQVPNLAVIDFAMPGINGAEVAKAIRARQPGLPILFLSGYADTSALQSAIGRAPLLRKPFDSAELACAVRDAIDGAAR